MKGMVAIMENNKLPEVVIQAEEITENTRKETAENSKGTKPEGSAIDSAAENAREGFFGRSKRNAKGMTKQTAENSAAETERKTAGKTTENSTTETERETAGKTAETKRNTVRKSGKNANSWIGRGILVSAVLALIMFCMYDFFRDRAEEYKSSPIEEYNNITWLYQNCYLLYKDLYNAQNDEQKNYKELYLQPKEGFEWILAPNAWDENSEAFQERVASFEGMLDSDLGNEDYFYELRDEVTRAETFFQELESCYSILNSNYDYVIRDNTSGAYLTNMSDEDLNRGIEDTFFHISFVFNEHGLVTVGDHVAGMDTAQIRKYANEAVRSNTLSDYIGNGNIESFSRYGAVSGPADCTVTYCISEEEWAEGQTEMHYVSRALSSGSSYSTSVISYGRMSQWAYYRSVNMGGFLLVLLLIALLLGLLLPVTGISKPWKEVKICSLPLEYLLAIGIVVFAVFGEWIFGLIVYTASGKMEKVLGPYFVPFELEYAVVFLINMVCLTAFFFCGWYLGICARAVRELGVKEYIKQRCIFYRIFPFIKGKVLGFYHALSHFDVTTNANKMIVKIVLINAVVLFLISCLWFGGFAVTAVYSMVLYVALRKYISDLQKKYGQLLHATNEIAKGNLNVTITEDLGVFEPFKPQVIRIQNGFKNAVEEETKSQRMKAELITNVSHDLKTPLTAIITYINLLKDENITEQQRREYLDTLERKSLRLKVLIEDLFEVSKANSQNITLNIMDVDIMNLVKQVSFEMSDKLAASNLDVRMNLSDEKIILPLDSQKTYRVYENLLGNIAKYALPGTRVYINGFRIDDTVIITMKNISAQEITVDTAELTERFVRGDASRNTEGSGLGLAIAKSFMELQGGELSLEVDGDLFKAATIWHI